MNGNWRVGYPPFLFVYLFDFYFTNTVLYGIKVKQDKTPVIDWGLSVINIKDKGMNTQPQTKPTVNPTNRRRWNDALALVDRIDCTIGNALTLLSGGNYEGKKLDYWQDEYMTADEARDSRDELEHQRWVATHTL